MELRRWSVGSWPECRQEFICHRIIRLKNIPNPRRLIESGEYKRPQRYCTFGYIKRLVALKSIDDSYALESEIERPARLPTDPSEQQYLPDVCQDPFLYLQTPQIPTTPVLCMNQPFHPHPSSSACAAPTSPAAASGIRSESRKAEILPSRSHCSVQVFPKRFVAVIFWQVQF